MAVRTLDPETLPRSDIYAQLSIASGSRLVHLSGQVARDADGGPVGQGDLAAQTAQAFRNVGAALLPRGDVRRRRQADRLRRRLAAREDGSARRGAPQVAASCGGDPRRPITLIGVAALGEPDLLIEIEAVAVLD